MRKDSVYWIYRLRLLTEGIELLSEEERRLLHHNSALVLANEMAHSGSSKSDVHKFLQENVHEHYPQLFLTHWFTSGGDVPVINYVRHNVLKKFNVSGNIRLPHFESKEIHDHLINDDLSNYFKNIVHPSSKLIHASTLPEQMTLYRGVGLPIHTTGYKPHAIESWTTDVNTARHFANAGKEHDASLIPHIFKANVHRDNILWSYLTRDKNKFIPHEDNVVGKQEFVPFGHKLQNIERIE